MKTRTQISLFALAAAAGWAAPAQAQDSAVQAELAAMRAQMQAMAQRIDTLESQLVGAQAQAQSATLAASEAAASAAVAAEAAKPGAAIAWKGAPELSGEGGWSFKPRGRLQYDAGFVNAPDSTGRSDGFGNEVRRARLGVQGGIPGGFGYKFEVDFADGGAEFADAFLSYEDGDLTAIVGQHNNFQGLEELTSSLNTSFIERAAFTDAFGFERRVGASAQYGSKAFLVQGGLFTDNVDDLSNKNWGADGRLVFMPKMGETQLHLGGSLHYADLEPGSTVRYRQRPLVHFTSERFIDTRNLGAAKEMGYGLEAAAIRGPFHAAAEAYWQNLSRPGALSDPTFFGGYAEAGLFLTRGDSRGYKGGTFDRVKPKNGVDKGGFGAVQINVRYDWLDLTDAGIIGGSQDGYYLSLIWTPTAYTRFMANYGRIEYDNAVHPLANGSRSYGVDAFGVRAQVDF